MLIEQPKLEFEEPAVFIPYPSVRKAFTGKSPTYYKESPVANFYKAPKYAVPEYKMPQEKKSKSAFPFDALTFMKMVDYFDVTVDNTGLKAKFEPTPEMESDDNWASTALFKLKTLYEEKFISKEMYVALVKSLVNYLNPTDPSL